MRPLIQWPAEQRARIRGVFTDIDDTLTTDGRITPDALAALTRLRLAGLPVFAITGRPAGWSETFALTWPVNAIVAENGAVALWRGAQGQLHKAWLQDAATRLANRAHLDAVAQTVLRQFPQAHLAEDSSGRETDIAIDHSERHLLPADTAEAIAALMRAQGLNATISSIHINGWIGDHNKLVGARWILREHLQWTLEEQRDQWLYVGDSTNDQVMFAGLSQSAGVANLQRFLPLLTHRPRYLAHAERGAGFAEVVDALLAAQ